MSARSRVAVLGGGAWGSVLAALAARHGHDVAIWEIDGAAAELLARDRTSGRSVPGFRLPAEVSVSSDIQPTVAGREIVVVAVPSASVVATLRAAAAATAGVPVPAPSIVCASKDRRRVAGRAGRRALGSQLRSGDRARVACRARRRLG